MLACLLLLQVPKPISFFLSAQSDEKNVKQLLRLILSKFSRRQPTRSDNDWASMWRDLLSFQEKAFPFLDLEYILIEFIRGLLKAGKFSLARNYLKGTASVSLAPGKAENLVIQAAREYFFSASSLSCSEVSIMHQNSALCICYYLLSNMDFLLYGVLILDVYFYYYGKHLVVSYDTYVPWLPKACSSRSCFCYI